jgi:eukaryotic-like serine/threonine-protein kinase
MPGKITLDVTDGPMKGKVFTFDEHDTFIFGRDTDCHARLSEDDTTASRHHFVLEVNPPYACVRDLGSLNGTYVNGVKHGGRAEQETPEDVAGRLFPEVDVKNGDQIRVGETLFSIKVDLPAFCNRCGVSIPESFKIACRFEAGVYTCPQCVEDEKKGLSPRNVREPIRCKQCAKEVSDEIGPGRQGDYICKSCREKLQSNPIQGLLAGFFDKFKRPGDPEKAEFPGYEVGEILGEGGMGSVYLARRERDGAKVAIKVMLSKVAVDDDSRTLFKREIDVTQSLRHPNIVELYEHGSAGAGFYFVMEYCLGGSVDSLMEKRGGTLSIEEARPIILQALEALSFAHEKGFVHRDLKPQNILLTSKSGGTAKIADFGLAKSFQKAGFSGMTVTGAAAGTPVFMPKEQLANFKYVKPASDVWSMAATLYNMLTGYFCYEIQRGQSPMEVVLQGRIIPIRDRDRSLPKKLTKVIDRALAVEDVDRYQTAGEFRDALKKVI